MAAVDIWGTIAGERRSLADDLSGLSADAWDTPSWSSEWTVRDVVAHMTATTKLSAGSFFPKLIGSGFKLSRLQAKDIATERGSSPEDTLARFRAQIDSKGRPPGPVQTLLGETIVHSEDIRRALGINHEYPTDAVVEVADFYKGSNLILGNKRRIAGLHLEATDTEWQNGSGPNVSGPILGLVLAMTGRKGALEGLQGDGVATLSSRP